MQINDHDLNVSNLGQFYGNKLCPWVCGDSSQEQINFDFSTLCNLLISVVVVDGRKGTEPQLH